MPAMLVAAAIAGGCAQLGGIGTEAPAALLETYWRPVEIESKPVVIRPGTREPHFVLSAAGNSVRGLPPEHRRFPCRPPAVTAQLS